MSTFIAPSCEAWLLSKVRFDVCNLIADSGFAQGFGRLQSLPNEGAQKDSKKGLDFFGSFYGNGKKNEKKVYK